MFSSSTTSSHFPNPTSQGHPQNMYVISGEHQHHHHPIVSSTNSLETTTLNPEARSFGPSLLYNLSLLKDKVEQVQSLVTVIMPNLDHSEIGRPTSSSVAVASMVGLIEEIMVTASSMFFICQQMMTSGATSGDNAVNSIQSHQIRPPKPISLPNLSGLHQQSIGINNRVVGQLVGDDERVNHQNMYSSETLDWYADSNHVNSTISENNQSCNAKISTGNNKGIEELPQGRPPFTNGGSSKATISKNFDIIELDAAELLAKYTHYCQICAKGFKRDANLRMHMRAHGDEYKSASALSNPLKNTNSPSAQGLDKDCLEKLPRKYSCPHEGCRWNQKHAKFQPLKSMICVKNHYKRSHCPKMYVCKRCNKKQFSVLSDLRTHEKHCGYLKWLCSCGTTFSRKDKLMGHVALFVGHKPLINTTKQLKVEQQASSSSMQIDDRG